MAYDGSIRIDTKINTTNFSADLNKLKSIAETGATALVAVFTASAVGITAALTKAVDVGSSFESAMDKVSAISGANADELAKLTDKAKEMGATTKFSASESAQALQYMAMAGWKTENMLDGIKGIMSLAAADGLDLATTSDIVTDAITAFGLKASDSNHFADVLAKTSSSANTNVSMLGESFKYVAPLAGTMGYSVEDVSVALGLMANASVKGSIAGTSLRMALASMSAPSETASEKMNELGLSMIDSKGNSLSLMEVLKTLRIKFGDLSETEQTAAASTIFGKEAMSGMLAIINAGEDDFNNLVNSINNADGSAKNMAETMQGNLQGQFTILKSSLEGLGINIYESLSEPLTEATIEAQNYVNKLSDAFTDGSFEGLIDEAGKIFAKLAVKAAEQAPKLVESAINLLEAFCKGISDNSDKLIQSAKLIIKTITDNTIKILPVSVQKPIKKLVSDISGYLSEIKDAVKDAILIIKKSIDNGGIKKSIETSTKFVSNLSKTITNITKVVLPLLANAVDFITGKIDIILPLIVGIYTALTAFSIITSIVTSISALTTVLEGVTVAQYAWNTAMEANPIGLVATAVGILAGALTSLNTSQDNVDKSAEHLYDSQNKVAEAYSDVFNASKDYIDGISGASDVLDGFNDSIVLSKDKQQQLATDMEEVQTEITEIARTAKEKRTKLTEDEIQRLDDLFAKEKELAEQQLNVQKGYQEVVKDISEDLVANNDLTLAEYESYSKKYTAAAEETRDDVVSAAEDERTNILAEKRALIGTSDEYTQEWYEKERDAANKDYQETVKEADKLCADTLLILQNGYYDKSDALHQYSNNIKKYNEDIENENKRHSEELQSLKEQEEKAIQEEIDSGGCDSWLIEREWDERIQREKNWHNEILSKLNEDYSQSFSQEQKDQLGTWLAMVGQTELYGGKIEKTQQDMVDNMIKSLKTLPPECKDKINLAFQGMYDAIKDKAPELVAKVGNVGSSCIKKFKEVFDIHSPSRKTKKIFGQLLQGGEVGLDDEAPNLYKQAETVGTQFTNKLKNAVNADSLINSMRSVVKAGQAELSSTLTSKVVHDVNVQNNDNKKVVLKGDITTRMNVDGREFAVATAPYISEELAWEG